MTKPLEQRNETDREPENTQFIDESVQREQLQQNPNANDQRKREIVERFRHFPQEGLLPIIEKEHLFSNTTKGQARKKEIAAEIAQIDYTALQLLLVAPIYDNDEHLEDNPFFQYTLKQYQGDIEQLLHGIGTVVDGISSEDNEDGIVSFIVGRHTARKEIIQEALGNMVRRTDDIDEAANIIMNSGMLLGMDRNNFEYSVIETLHNIATIYPETRQHVENLNLRLLDIITVQEYLGFGGEYQQDTKLTQSSEYQDIELHEDFRFSNITSTQIVHCINRIGNHGSKKSIDHLLQFYQSNSALYVPYIARACSRMNPQYTINQIQQQGLAQHQDRFIRKNANAIWHRLELGRMGIEEGVVNYLGKLYELQGEEVERAHEAERITETGKIGVFGSEGELLGYFELGNLTAEERKQVEILEISRKMLFSDIDNALQGSQEQEKLRAAFLQGYQAFFSKQFIEQAGIHANNASLREQFWLYHYMNDNRRTAQERERILAFIQRFDEPGMKAFIALESDRGAGEQIQDLAKRIPEESMNKLLLFHKALVHTAETRSVQLVQELGEQSGISEEMIQNALLVRAKDILISAHRRIVINAEDEKQVIAELTATFEQEREQQQVISGTFRKMAEVLREQEENSVNLERYLTRQEALRTTIAAEGNEGLFLRALHERGELAPIPEIHWRVDRTSEEYQRRFGININTFLESIREPDRKKLLVEFGPGSGQAKYERANMGLQNYYTDLAIADKAYYPLSGLVRQVVSWNRVQEELKTANLELTNEDMALLSDMLYKLIMINDGETAKTRFSYNTERIQEITRNPERVKQILEAVALQLSMITAVPSVISSRDEQGNVIYPNSINVQSPNERSQAFLAAKNILATRMGDMLKNEEELTDIFEAIPAYVEGTMISDFSGIRALAPNQIDVAIGVRSTVYKRGDEYVEFMWNMTQKLRDGGIYIDDNVRDNDGYRYRLAELQQLQQRLQEEQVQQEEGELTKIALNLILGPGFPGEDYNQTTPVPLAVVMTKNANHEEALSAELAKNAGYTLIDVDTYNKQQEEIRKLDESAATLTELLAVQEEEPKAA